MTTSQEAGTAPDQYSGEKLILAFQELAIAGIETRLEIAIAASSSEQMDYIIDRSVGQANETGWLISQLPDYKVSNIAQASLLNHEERARAHQAHEREAEKYATLTVLIGDRYAGRLATVHALEGARWPITRLSRDRFGVAQASRKDLHPDEVTAQISPHLVSGHPPLLGMSRIRSLTRKRLEYDVKTVDPESGVPLVAIEFHAKK